MKEKLGKIGQNDACPCDSGKKFKKCCRDLKTVAELKAWNESLYEVMVNEVREKDPEGFAHKQRYKAYHEAGHALMEMLIYGDLKRVSTIPFFESLEEVQKNEANVKKGKGWTGAAGVCIGIEHTAEEIGEEGAFFSFQQMAILLAGKAAADFFCTCEMHVGGDERDQEDLSALTANVADEHKARFASAVTAVLQRHRPQLDAIVEALIERETLSGAEVRDVMLAKRWNPETDADPDLFYSEALGIAADGAAA